MKKQKKSTSRTKILKFYNKKQKKVICKRKRHIKLNPPIIIPDKEIIQSSVKAPRKRRTKNSTRMYFTQETEDAIILYNKTNDLNVREQIFRNKILQPFQKLIENIFNTFKFSYFETGPQDVQKECLTHLVANLHKYDPNRTSKTDPKKKTRAFAYFSIIAKHYLILLNNTNYKKFNQSIEISEEKEENTVQLQQNDKYYAQQELSDFIKLIIDFWEKNVEKIFTKQRDLNIANAIIELFRNSDRIDSFNKKALYLYIREIASCKTQQITKVINRMKQYHNIIQKSYLNHGIVNIDRYTLI
ncbi:MAG TPA: hypothetical protein PL028_00200 [Bacteroidales bacterium]|nr:hypothetical protein [Bacteroidales bacterium]